MRAFRSAILVTVCFAFGLPASAQQQAPAPQYVLVAYYRCDINRQARADSLYERYSVPVLERMVQEGKLTRYALSAHRHGGAWRRVESLVGNDVEALFRAQEELGEAAAAGAGASAQEFTEICNSHDDYLWTQTLTGGPAPAQPVYSWSVYYECDPAREDQADGIMERLIAPILNRHVAAGHLTSWSWLEHAIGGPFRRALVMRAADLAPLLGGVTAVLTDMRASAETADFATICPRHADYIWSPVVAG